MSAFSDNKGSCSHFAGGYENSMSAATAEKRPARRCTTAAKEERQSNPIAFYDSEQCEVAQE